MQMWIKNFLEKNTFFCISISVVFNISIIEYSLCNIVITYVISWLVRVYEIDRIAHMWFKISFSEVSQTLIRYTHTYSMNIIPKTTLYRVVVRSLRWPTVFIYISLMVSYRSFINNPPKIPIIKSHFINNQKDTPPPKK